MKKTTSNDATILRCGMAHQKKEPNFKSTHIIFYDYCRYKNSNTLYEITYDMYHSRLNVDIFR